jgi:hypothetical protein
MKYYQEGRMANKFSLSFKLRNETKGAVRYEEVDDNGSKKLENYVVGTMYVRKSAIVAPWPRELEIQIKG